MRATELAAIALGLVALVLVGWVNTHTDELLVVIPLVVLLAGTFGLSRPRDPWVWAFVIGGAVPLSQLVALTFGWRVPYPNDIASIETSCFAFAPAFIAAYAGAVVRRISPPASPH